MKLLGTLTVVVAVGVLGGTLLSECAREDRVRFVAQCESVGGYVTYSNGDRMWCTRAADRRAPWTR
jgi:hypothetical protein